VVAQGAVPADVERFWAARDGLYALDDAGFLRDPDSSWYGSGAANSDAVRTTELREQRCLALLGEPGSGKSTEVARAERLVPDGVPVVSFDLAAYGSEERLVSEVFGAPELVDWAAGTGKLCLVLDSLDEVRSRVPHVGSVVADRVSRLPHERLLLRIACRTADWPAHLEQRLSELYEDLAVLEMLPLRRADASAIAVSWCEPSAFLDEVARAGAGPLAARPLTLRFLARAFGRTGTLPERGAALYRIGVRALCEEQSPSRRDAGPAMSVDQRIAVARRVAAATVFGGVPAIWTGPEVDVDGEDIPLERLTGGVETAPSGAAVQVGAAEVRDAARTGLFTSRGGQRVGWAHATFADFLAAEWVVANDLSAEQARSLFLDAGGRCWPQTRLAATWVVAIAPDRFGFLVASDPAAFQGEVELPGDALRAAVIDGLLAVASTIDAPPWARTYGTLTYPGVAGQLRPYLRNDDPDRRRVALDLTEACAPVELRDDLVAIALDREADNRDRVDAGWTLSRLTAEHRTAALRPLALDADARGDDPQDDLRGVGLLASWPQALSVAEVFAVLTPANQRNYHGAYAAFLGAFRDGITEDDVDAGLAWLLRDLDGPDRDHDLAGVANRILLLAAQRPVDRHVVEAFVRVVRARVDEDRLLFEDYRRDEPRDPLKNPALRHAVAASLLESNAAGDRMLGYGLRSLGVVRADDLAWLADRYVQAAQDERGELRSLFRWTFDVDNPVHRDLVLGMSTEHPLHADLVHAWVDAVPLDSPEAQALRQTWALQRPSRPADVVDDGVEKEIDELLGRFDAGEAVGFWYSVRLLTVAPGSQHFGAEFDPDVSGMPRWSALAEATRERLVRAAERYLREFPCDPGEWLDRPDIVHHPSAAGYRAMLLLLREAGDRLRGLPASAWTEWAPVLATSTTAMANGAKWEDKLRLFELAGPVVVSAARDALIIRVQAECGAGKRPFLANEAGYLWDDTVASTYLALARTSGGDPREEVVDLLARRDLDPLRPVLLEWLADQSDAGRFRLAATTLIDVDLDRSWDGVRAAFGSDTALAEDVLGGTLTVRGFALTDDLSAPVLADLYLWLRAHFPPETDPTFDDAHFVGRREQIGQWRDKLLRRLQDEGSPAAVHAIRRIGVALPDVPWIGRVLVAAEAALRRTQWTPTTLPELLRLAHDRRTVVVHSSAALARAVVSVLDEIQVGLTGATPASHYLWDTHTGRPKTEDEVSDYLRNELDRALAVRGIVVNREVQVRRNRASGIGERTDLLVEAAAATGPEASHISLPVEVKGAWNAELTTALEDQLVGRYMRDTSAEHGIFLVVWPDLAAWKDEADDRRRTIASLDRSDVESRLADQASSMRTAGRDVEVVHLDIDYLRPA
jgi:hypothetical protein